MKSVFLFFIPLLLMNACHHNSSEHHIIYLHGQIIEIQGTRAISKEWGEYAFYDIVDSLKNFPAKVYADVRDSNVHFVHYCQGVSERIDSLINLNIPAKNITIIGASKGGVMAMFLSDMITHPINYIFLGSNNTEIERENNWRFKGRILAIYEKSDPIAGKPYDYWQNRSTKAIEFNQLELNTGMGHGFIYRPIQNWLLPTKEWIAQK